MRTPLITLRRVIPALAGVIAFSLSACGPATPSPTPTMSVDAIYTAAFHTLVAQQATQLALTPPTPTPTQTPLPTVAIPTVATLLPFGTATTSAGGGAQGCDSAVFVSDVTIPDGTVMTPGKGFVKTWAIMNNGTCGWTTAYKLTFLSGDSMGGTSVPLAIPVPPGQQTQVSVSLSAPAKPGSYTGSWQMQNANGQPFGNIVTVVIKVSGGSSATDTPGAPAPSDTPAGPTPTP